MNETLVGGTSGRTDITELRIPCTRLARDAGDDSLVSVVALGALVGYLGLVRPTAIRNAIRETIGTRRLEVLDADLAAFDVGHRVGARSPAASRRGGDPGLGSGRRHDERDAAGVARVSRRCARGGAPRASRGPAAPRSGMTRSRSAAAIVTSPVIASAAAGASAALPSPQAGSVETPMPAAIPAQAIA